MWCSLYFVFKAVQLIAFLLLYKKYLVNNPAEIIAEHQTNAILWHSYGSHQQSSLK